MLLRTALVKTCSSPLHLQFADGLRVLILVGRAIMPDRLVLHVADTLALGGAGDDHQRPLAGSLADSVMESRGIVAIDLGGFPAEGRELGRKRIKGGMRLRRAAEAL